MGENEYGRLWDHLISDEPPKVAEAASSFTSPNHTSTPTTTASGALSLSRGEKRKKADGDSDAHTPSKRSTQVRDILGPLVVEALPTQKPGMFPWEVTTKLLQNISRLPQDTNPTTLETQVRIILGLYSKDGKVSRVDAAGPKRGKSHQYVQNDSSRRDSDMCIAERVLQSSPGTVLGPDDRVEHGDETHVDNSTLSQRQSGKGFHIAQNSQQHPGAEITTESDRLEPSFEASVSQDEQGGAWRTSNSTSEARYGKHEQKDIVDKVLATKELFAHHTKLTGEGKGSSSGGSTAEAQMLREQAAEAERKALSHQKDAEKLKEEAKNRKEDDDARAVRIARAREESALNTELMRQAVEETFGGGVVNLLSARTQDAF
ncbi:hypothetical protein Q7P35_009839 [Cladosporium inversicolor]